MKMELKIGDTIKRKKDGHPMKVVKDDEAVLYADNDRIGITDATAYLEFGAIEIAMEEKKFECDYCEGDGYIVNGRIRCPKCNGEFEGMNEEI